MMTRRKLEALRNLAERPGTPAEGEAARRALARAEAVPSLDNPLGKYAQFMRSGSLDDLAFDYARHRCECGTDHPAFTRCPNGAEHDRIAAEIRRRFPRGTRVYYNRWAYPKDCPGVVVGYAKATQRTNGSYPWAWARVKFEHLKQVRCVPVYSLGLWYLTDYPLHVWTKES